MRKILPCLFGVIISVSLLSCNLKESEEYITAFRASGSSFGIYPIVGEDQVSAEYTLNDSESYWVGPAPIVDDRHLLSIKEEIAKKGDTDQRCLLIQLNEKGTEIMAQYTEEHYDERVAIMINDQLIVAPVIKATITTGHIRSTINRNDGKSLMDLLQIEDYME